MGTFKGVLCLLLTGVAVVSHAVTIDFNELPAWDFSSSVVPEEMRLSDHYLSTHGVVFSSLDPNVAVVNSFSWDSSNGLIGTTGGEPMFFLSATELVTATFYNPSNPSEKRTASQVSMEISMLFEPALASLTAYDINGAPIATNSVNIISTGGEISVSAEGIHIVEFRGDACTVDSITFSADSGFAGGEEVELWTPILSVDLGTNVVKVIKDPIRPFVYALNKTGGEVLFIDLNRQEVVDRLTVGASPNGGDVDASGKYLYVGHGGDGSGVAGSFRIEKIDLDSRSSVATYVVPTITQNNSPLRAENITCGAGDTVYYNAAYTVWNNGLARQMDGATGTDQGALPIIKSPMVISPDKGKLYGQHRYTGNLGEMGVWEISEGVFTKVDRYSYSPYPYGWDYNNYSISGDGQLLSLGYKLFNANDLDDVKGDFDEVIYGLNADGSVAFGKTAIWDTTTFSDLGEATKITDLLFSSTVMDFDAGEQRLFAFNAADQTLRVFGEPNPLQVYSIDVVDIEAYEGGEFYPSNLVFALENSGVSNVSWSASAPAELSLIPDHGELASGERVQVIVSPDPSIPVGSYDYTLVFSNITFGLERERGFGLTVYPAPQAPAAPFSPVPAHDASFVPVVDVSVELEWEHVNAEDDAGPWNTASIYDVHMGTSPTGMVSMVSGLTNTVFNPGQLELNTTYYWQVVASNVVGVTPGPVWQFTTWKHGPVDHFEWTVPDTEQKIETPFEVTVRAVDENGVWVPDYSNSVEIVGLEKPSFVEDFEGGRSEGWLATPGTTQSISITDTVSAVGTNSLLLQGYDENHEKYYYHDLPGGQPTDVEFRVRAENFYGYGANVQLRDGEGGAFAYFYLGYVDMRFNGWKIYDRYAGNQWYKINFKLDWATRRVECYVNGSYRTGGSFLSTADSVSHISLHNYDKSKTWIDEIRVEQSISIPLETVPTNTVPLVDGEWRGEVVVGQAAETALFRATDALGHTGDSDLIAVAGYRGDLSIILPARVDEGSGLLAGAGQLVVSPAPAGDLTVNLSADEDGLISVPAQVVIPAAQTNVFFDLQVSDDSLLDGSETTTLHALSDGYRAAEASMLVDDDETATLTLSLPQTTVEGSDFINGALQLDRAPDRDVVVELLSNNPDKVGSSSVVVPAGQTFVAFTLPVIENAVIDGIQTATIEAFVQNWQSGIASVFVFDNENRQIDLQLPASFLEGAGLATNAGSVTLSGSTTMDVHVLLTVSDSSELTVPGYVTVKAGQTAAFFDVTVPDDAEMDGTQKISVLAETPDYVPAVRYVDVQDNEVHHFEVFMTNTEVSVFASVPVEIVAKTIDGLTIPKVDGPLSFAASGDGGTVPVEPSVSTNLMQGIAYETLAFGKVENNVQLLVEDGMGHSGTGSLFNVVGSVISLTPAALTNTLVVAGGSMTRTMVISNAGNADLEFTIRTPLEPLDPEVPDLGNLVLNGDFEEGNTNFTSGYEYSPDVGTGVRGTYAVGDDSATWDTSLSTTMNDHTSGTGQMMMVSGNMTANTIVWQQEVKVVAGETYNFSAWAASLSVDYPPTLDFQINGVSVGSVLTEHITWTEFAAEWTATSSVTAVLSMVNTQVLPPFIPTGNKFAVDDISFMKQGNSSMQDDSLIAHFPFNGDATDESGNGHDGTVNGATLTADRFGNPDAAYDFNGSSDFINCGNIINGFSNFTVMAWINIFRFTDSRYMGPWSQMKSSYNTGNGNYLFYTGYDTSVGCFGTSMRWDDGVGIDTRTSYAVPMNEWRLIAQTYDGNTVRQYDNGTLINETVTGEHTLGSEWDFLIGKTFAYPGYLTTDYFAGQIDDLRVYDRALTEAEIQAQSNSSADDQPVAQGITITVVDDNSSGLIASYPFSGDASDESGNGHDGSVSGATLTEDRFGNADSAYHFDGAAYITCGDVLDRKDGSWTYAAWIRSSDYNQTGIVMNKGLTIYGIPSKSGYGLYNYGPSISEFRMVAGDDSGNLVNAGYSGSQLPVNEYVFITGVFDAGPTSTVVRLFINGVQVSSENVTQGYSDSNLPLNFGAQYLGYGSPTHGFVGDIDDISIYNRVLSELEISELYNEMDNDAGLIASYPFNGDASDESGNGHNGTVSGATLTTDRFGNADSAYLFDGTNDSIRIGTEPDFPSWENYTVSTWVLNDGGGDQNGNYGQKILDKTVWYHDFYLSVMKTGALRLMTYENSTASAISEGEYDYRDNKWHHVAVTKAGSIAAMWIDGVSVGTVSNAASVFSTGELLVGYTDSADTLQQRYWSGKIDDIRIYNRALSESEVVELFSADDVVEPPVSASWVSVGPVSGTVAPGSSTTVRVTFDAAGLVAGDYSNAVLTVLCNDAVSLTNSIPVSMYVVPSAPGMVAEPESTEGLSNELMWSGVAGPVEYWVEAATSTNSVAVQDSGWVGTTNYTFTGLATDTVYFYRTKASVQSSIGLLEGAWSDWVWSTQIAALLNADGDGLPDWWEEMYFGGPTNANPLLDFDGDGQSNGDEFIAGMNPTNAGSLFMVNHVIAEPEAFFIRWDAVTGRVYSVRWKNGMTNDFQTLETGIRYPQNSYTDTVHAVEDSGFYCIDVELDTSSITNPPVAELYQ